MLSVKYSSVSLKSKYKINKSENYCNNSNLGSLPFSLYFLYTWRSFTRTGAGGFKPNAFWNHRNSESKVCNDPDNWSYTAIGSKACGGPKGYIAYSNEIDVDAFLNKVEDYNRTEAEF